jgi:predicted small lipoprotein YifL
MTRGACALAALAVALAACGHYGPPVRASRAGTEPAATTTSSEPAPAAAQPEPKEEPTK